MYWNNVVQGLYIAGHVDGPDQARGAWFLPRHDRVSRRVCARLAAPRASAASTTNAVVAGSVAVLAIDFLVTKLLDRDDLLRPRDRATAPS